MRPNPLRYVADHATDSQDRVVFGLPRIIAVFVEVSLPWVGRGLDVRGSLSDGLARVNHFAELRDDGGRDLREHSVNFLPQKLLYGESVDLGEALVDLEEPQLPVQVAEAEGRVRKDVLASCFTVCELGELLSKNVSLFEYLIRVFVRFRSL